MDNNINQNYNNMNDYIDYNDDYMYYNDDINNDVYNNRYNYNYDRRFDNRFDRRYNRYDRDRDFFDPMRYYRYPYCDRYGRCENPIWWIFWPLFFL